MSEAPKRGKLSAFTSCGVFGSPAGHGTQNGREIFAFCGQGILTLILLGYNALCLQIVEALRQRARIDTACRAFEFTKSFWPATESSDDEGCPFVTQYLCSSLYATEVWLDYYRHNIHDSTLQSKVPGV